MNYVFDLDGTLINSSARHYVLLEKLLAEFNINAKNHSGKKYLEYKRGGGNTLRYLKEELQVSDADARNISNCWIEQIEDFSLIENYDVLYGDTLETLNKLKDKNRIFYLTCRQNAENAIKELKFLDIYGFAEDIMICNPQNASQNKTACILNKFDNPENTVLVGDTEAEYTAAIQSGCAYYILNRGFRNKEYFEKRGIRSFDNLLPLTEIKF